MTTNDLATWGQILSSIAVLITLIYLAVEVKQNTEALHAQTRQSLLAGGHAELFEMVEHPELILNFIKPETLDAEDYVRLHSFLAAIMRGREFAWLQYRKGIIDEDQWQTELAVMNTTLTTKRPRLWWDKLGRKMFNPRFVEFVDNTVAKNIDHSLVEMVQSWDDPS